MSPLKWWRISCAFLVCIVGGVQAGDFLLKTDATWRTINGTVAIPTNWNINVVYDDSSAAGWTNAFKAPNGDRIWNTSNVSSESPTNPRFRHTFALSGPVTSATAHFYFDDDATVWINGTEVLDDTDGHTTTFDNLVLSPSLFQPGENLIAVWGHNKVAPYNTIEVDITLAVAPMAPVLRATEKAGELSLSWDAFAGISYQVQYTANLTQPNWANLGGPITATNSLAVASDTLSGNASRFYRVLVLQ